MEIRQIRDGSMDYELLTEEYGVELEDCRAYVLKMHEQPNHPLLDEIFDWLSEYGMDPGVYSWGTPRGVERMYLVFDHELHALLFRRSWTN